jgi:hypothetical protein
MSNDIPFPSRLHPLRPPVQSSASIAAPVSNGSAIVRALAKIASQKSAGIPVRLPDITWVIRTALPSITRRGKAWASLPELHRELLDRHIAAGDPTARMFKDWIENRHIPEARPARLADPIVVSVAKDDAHDA